MYKKKIMTYQISNSIWCHDKSRCKKEEVLIRGKIKIIIN
jgi:hypothetical protein